MPTLREVLEPYIITSQDNFLTMLQKASQFSNILQVVDSSDSPAKYIIDICQIFLNTRRFSANQLLAVFDQIGVDPSTDWDKILQFLQKAKDINFNFQKLNRCYPRDLYEEFKDELEEVSSSFVVSKFREAPFVPDNLQIRTADKTYYVPKSLKTLKSIIRQFHGDELKYVSERRDCDDFAIMFKAFLSRHNLGNLSCGIFWGRFETSDGHVFGHAVNICLYKSDNDYEVILYEPQSELTLFTENQRYTDINGFFIMV